MNLPLLKLALAVAPLLLLGACGKSSSPQAGSTASGEILPASVSDAMLDTSGSQAQAPLAPAALGGPAKAGLESTGGASEPALEGPADTATTVASPTPDSPTPKPSAKAATP